MNIDSYRFGHIEIDHNAYDSDIIILPQRVHDHWWRKEGHSLYPADLDTVLDARPQTLIVGTGYYGRMSIPEATRQYLQDQGIELQALPTRDAVQQYNQICDSGKVVAALHLTC